MDLKFDPATGFSDLFVKNIWTSAYIQEPSTVNPTGDRASYLMAWSLLADLSTPGQTLEIKALRDTHKKPYLVFHIHSELVATSLRRLAPHYQSQHPVKKQITVKKLSEIAETITTYPATVEGPNKDKLAILECLMAALKAGADIEDDGKVNFFNKVRAGCTVVDNRYFSPAK